MNGELEIYPSASRNFWILITSIFLGLIFPLTTAFYFLFAGFDLDIFAGLLIIASLVMGVQMVARVSISAANLANKKPRIVFSNKGIEFDLPFIKSFSISLDDVEVIYRFVGYEQKMTPIHIVFSERESLVFVLKNKSHSRETKRAKLLDYFGSLVTPTGGSLVSKKPENDYLVVSNIFYAGSTADTIKKLNALGFTKTDPSFSTPNQANIIPDIVH